MQTLSRLPISAPRRKMIGEKASGYSSGRPRKPVISVRSMSGPGQVGQNDVHTILRAEPVRVYREMSTRRVKRLADGEQVGDFLARRQGGEGGTFLRIGLEA